MKGSAGIFIIIAILAAAFIGYLLSSNFLSNESQTPQPSIAPQYKSLSENPEYKEVKEKYNLTEEQLQILSTVDSNDND